MPDLMKKFRELVPVDTCPDTGLVRVRLGFSRDGVFAFDRQACKLLVRELERHIYPNGRCAACGSDNGPDGACSRPGCCNSH